MNIKITTCFLALVICLSACRSNDKNEKFFREDMLIQYIKKKKELRETKEYILVLANATDCGACSVETIINCSKSKLFNSLKKRYVLLNGTNPLLNEAFNQLDAQLIYEDNSIIEKYGLRLYSLNLFHIKNNNLVEWETIKPDEN